MTANPPTFLNLPPAPPDPITPTDAPGTPNSTTTTMSELSTVAIKDGHRGHFPHHHNPADAERADRISRLAGLERVIVGGRHPQGHAPGSASNPLPGYFDSNNQPQIFRERSTVGSASATGSVGGRTTWASGSDAFDHDRMSEDQDVDTSSVGGFSDEAASLVGFGEGARTPARQQSHVGSPAIGKAVPHFGGTEQQRVTSRDGNTYEDSDASRTPPLTQQGPGGATTAEQVIRDRLLQRQRQASLANQPGGAGHHHAQGHDAMDVEPQKED